MKRFIILAALLMGLGMSYYASAQDADDPFVHCLVLDKTLSMKGHGGADIWDDVQSYCYEWVDGVSVPSTVLFYTYDKDLYGPQKFSINSDSDKQAVKKAIENVVVDGRYTWIASNLEKVLNQVYSSEYRDNNKRFYLITDGIEEEPGSSFKAVLDSYSTKRGDYDHLYYVDLRDSADDQTKDALNETEGADIGKGFVKFITARPEFPEVNYTIGQSQKLEQRFIITSGDVDPALAFSLQIESIKNIEQGDKTTNVSISPSTGISFSKLTKIEEGKFKLDFSIDFLNSSARECDIVVKLVGSNQDDKELAFSPSSFCIKARNMPPPPPPTPPTAGSKDKKGWH